MALTGTATKTTRTCIVKSLDMQSPEIVSISLIKDNNIVYCVSEKSTILISRRTQFTEPPGAPDLARFRLVDMYTHCTHQSVKDVILERFTSQSSLRIVIANIALGTGMDCPDVHQIIHWGVPDDEEMYVQEIGQAGRDGALSCVLLFHGRGDLSCHETLLVVSNLSSELVIVPIAFPTLSIAF